MCRAGKSITESSNRIIKWSHQSILGSNKQVVSSIIESWSISLEELVLEVPSSSSSLSSSSCVCDSPVRKGNGKKKQVSCMYGACMCLIRSGHGKVSHLKAGSINKRTRRQKENRNHEPRRTSTEAT